MTDWLSNALRALFPMSQTTRNNKDRRQPAESGYDSLDAAGAVIDPMVGITCDHGGSHDCGDSGGDGAGDGGGDGGGDAGGCGSSCGGCGS
jgi:hypothetical protein